MIKSKMILFTTNRHIEYLLPEQIYSQRLFDNDVVTIPCVSMRFFSLGRDKYLVYAMILMNSITNNKLRDMLTRDRLLIEIHFISIILNIV